MSSRFSVVLSVLVALAAVSLVYLNLSAIKNINFDQLLGFLGSLIGCPHLARLDKIKAPTPGDTLKPTIKSKCLPAGEKLFTKEELAAYDGEPGSPGLYLAFLGVVYDVKKGWSHYGPDGGYHFFVGKDGSRAFITGEFDADGLVEDVTTLDVGSFGGIRDWAAFYDEEYTRVGRLVGLYYDKIGCSTSTVDQLESLFIKHDEQAESKEVDENLYPSCNSEWREGQDHTRLWCSKMSGGINRDWVGVPRQLYMPELKTYRCACIKNEGPPSTSGIVYADEDDTPVPSGGKDDGDLSNPRLREYEDCTPTATECKIKKQ